MRTIALMNQKGGVGKTTTTVNLGAALAEAGQRVCLIDLDPQAHLTINYGFEPSEELVSLYDVLIEDRSFLESVHKASMPNVAVVPSSIDLAAAEIELVTVIGRETLLKQRMDAANASEEFDYVLLDCPPSLGLLTINALCAADEVIIPMQPHFLALQGVAKLLETVQLVSQRINSRLKVSGIVLTMFDAQTKLSMEVVNELKNFITEAAGKNQPWSNAQIFETRIRRNIKLAESPSFGQTIFAYGPTSNGASDYRSLAVEVMKMSEPVTVASPPPLAASQIEPRPVSKIEAPQPIAASETRKPSVVETPIPVPKPSVAASATPRAEEPVAVTPSASPPARSPVSASTPAPIPASARAPTATRSTAPPTKPEPVSAPAPAPKVEIEINPNDLDLSKLAAGNVPPIELPPPSATETRRLRQTRVHT
ncbi:MAG: AAA family ATPase [Anaerolineae bacterium]|nr:AAA family ATPase [Phycisphaerae bacterium]